MLIAMGWKVHPLWQTLHLQPLLAVLTAFTMGFSIVVFEVRCRRSVSAASRRHIFCRAWAGSSSA